MKDIGRKIRQLRESKGMTQEELAHKVGYKSRVSINKIELQRDVPLKKLSAIAEALDVTPAFLAGWEDENGNAPDLADGIPMVIVEDNDDEEKRKEYHEFFSSLTEEQLEHIKPATLILAYLSQLNEEGIARAIEDIENLTYNPRYSNKDKNE